MPGIPCNRDTPPSATAPDALVVIRHLDSFYKQQFCGREGGREEGIGWHTGLLEFEDSKTEKTNTTNFTFEFDYE